MSLKGKNIFKNCKSLIFYNPCLEDKDLGDKGRSGSGCFSAFLSLVRDSNLFNWAVSSLICIDCSVFKILVSSRNREICTSFFISSCSANSTVFSRSLHFSLTFFRSETRLECRSNFLSLSPRTFLSSCSVVPSLDFSSEISTTFSVFTCSFSLNSFLSLFRRLFRSCFIRSCSSSIVFFRFSISSSFIFSSSSFLSSSSSLLMRTCSFSLCSLSWSSFRAFHSLLRSCMCWVSTWEQYKWYKWYPTL